MVRSFGLLYDNQHKYKSPNYYTFWNLATYISLITKATEQGTNFLQISFKKIENLLSGGPNKRGGCKLFDKK